jgi:hypothetical protein
MMIARIIDFDRQPGLAPLLHCRIMKLACVTMPLNMGAVTNSRKLRLI